MNKNVFVTYVQRVWCKKHLAPVHAKLSIVPIQNGKIFWLGFRLGLTLGFGFDLDLDLVLYLDLVCPVIFFASYSSLAFLMLCKRFAFKEQTSQQEKLEMIHFNLHLCPVYQVKCPINFVNVAATGAHCVKMRNFVSFFQILRLFKFIV